MITGLRRRHRWLAPLAFCSAAVVFTAGILARPTIERIEPRPFDAKGRAVLAFEPGVRVTHDAAASELIFAVDVPIDAPDLLVYSVPEPATIGGDLPAGARLLGTMSNAGVSRVSCDDARGALVIYSLGHAATVVAVDLGTAFADLESR